MSALSIGDLEPIFGADRAATLAAALVQQVANAADNMAHLIYIVGSIILIVTGSRRPWESLYQVRQTQNSQQQQQSNHHGDRTEAAAADMAASGLTVQPDGSRVSCFHCGAEVPLGSTVAASEAGHVAVSPHCYLNYINKLATTTSGHQPVNGQRSVVASEAERFSRALRKLAKDLASSAVTSAQSYGFSRNSVTFAATRHFMRNGGSAHERPGELLASVHQCVEEFGASADLLEAFSVERCLSLISMSPTTMSTERRPQPAVTATTSSAAAAPATVAPATVVTPAATSARNGATSGDITTSSSREAGSSNSDRCIVCRRNTRDRVVLPCAHFVTCSLCLNGLNQCPVCGSSIVATIRAYVT